MTTWFVKNVVFRSLIAWVGAGILSAASIIAILPFGWESASSSLNSYSAERALEHIKAIARGPHPIGSPSLRIVRTYLIDQMSALRIASYSSHGVGISSGPAGIAAGSVDDIIAGIPGLKPTGSILICVHYDSVFNGPGAADDSASIAIVLETLRALTLRARLRNDLVVLFTDGEEEGLLGAEAFAANSSDLGRIKLVINLEARGTRGPSVLFETGAHNQSLMEAIAGSHSPIVGSSFFYELYKLMPNDTDFTVFRNHGLNGVNFAFGGDYQAYHSMLDNVGSLDLRSIQQQGDYLFGLVKYFGDADLDKVQRKSGDSVFFDVAGKHLVAYPERWVIPSNIGLSIASILVLIFSVIMRDVRPGRVASALVALSVSVITVVGAAGLLWSGFASEMAGRLLFGDCVANGLVLVSLALWSAIITALLYRICRCCHTCAELALGGLLLLVMANWLVGAKLPGGSYILFWPEAFAVIACAVDLLFKQKSNFTWIVALFPVAVSIALFSPIIFLVYIFLTLQVAVAAATALAVCIVVLISPIVSEWAVPSGRRLVWMISLLGTLAVTTLLIGISLSYPTSAHPHHDSLSYCLDSDHHTAAWISDDRNADKWTALLLGVHPSTADSLPNYVSGTNHRLLWAPAAPLPLLSPLVTTEAVTGLSAGRPTPAATTPQDAEQKALFSLHLRSQRRADVIQLVVPDTVTIYDVTVQNRQIPFAHPHRGLRLLLYGFDSDDIKVLVSAKAPPGTLISLYDRTTGLPNIAPPRSPDLMAWQSSDRTIVSHRILLSSPGAEE